MINLGICARCPRCLEVSPSVTDSAGKVLRLPSVTCELIGSLLLGNSELPEGCIYTLEHTISHEDAFDAFEDLKEDGNGNST